MHKTWVHECTKSHRTERQGVEICSDCGQRGQFDGWQFGMYDAMGAYQLRTGLRPIGPHRGMADELLKGRWKDCEQCQGRGVITINDSEDYQICPRCHMRQYFFDGSQEEFEELIKRIVSAFPSAPVGAPLGLEPTQAADVHSGFVGGGFFRPRPKDRSLQAYKDWMNNILSATKPNSDDDNEPMTEKHWEESWKEFWSKREGRSSGKKIKNKSKSTSTGSTSSNMKITLSACNPPTRRIFETLVNGWKEAGGTVLCIRPGRIYLKLKTKAHTKGNSAQLPRNFNLVVLASPRGKRSAHIEVTWGLGKIKDLPPHLSTSYLDCVPKVVARFEKMVAALPSFEQKGSITRLMIDKQFKPLHTKLLMDGMREVKDAEAKAI